jgi:hypothetical protein
MRIDRWAWRFLGWTVSRQGIPPPNLNQVLDLDGAAAQGHLSPSDDQDPPAPNKRKRTLRTIFILSGWVFLYWEPFRRFPQSDVL